VGAGVAGLWLARRSSRTALLAAAATAGLVTALLLRAPGDGPFGAAARLGATARDMMSADGLVKVLWYRDGYGPAAMSIIAEHPWTGVGPGAFGAVVGFYSPPEAGVILPADNAQNWWRHQWAELGLLGALPAFACSLLAALAAIGALRSPTPAWALPVLGLGVLSLVSPPVQHPLLQVLVGALVSGCVLAARGDGPAPRPPAPSWSAAVWLAAIGCAAGLAAAGWTAYRPAFRAMRFQQVYSYGFSGEVPGPMGPGRWAATRAVGVFAAPPGTVLSLGVTLPHQDLATRPVAVTVSDRYGVVCREVVATPAPIACRIPTRAGEWMVAQVAVARAWDRENGQERAAFVTARFDPAP
jgi:hypothetical protein